MRRVQFRGYCARAACGTAVFSRRKHAKYCSRECSRSRFLPKVLQVPACLDCGEAVSSWWRRYCSLKCQQAFQFKIRAAAFENGAHKPLTCNSFVRKYLISKIGEKCSRCGWAERHPKTGRVPVEIEHIDGDWSNNCPENLTLLCPNCHSLTLTYRGLNRGRGRANRLGGRNNPLPTKPLSRAERSRIARLPTLSQQDAKGHRSN